MEFVNKIYTDGKKLFSYPFKVYYIDIAEGEEAQIIISVPKKLQKRAVARNYVRRRIRESIRLSRNEFPIVETKHILIVYTSSKKYEYHKIHEYISALLSKLSDSAKINTEIKEENK